MILVATLTVHPDRIESFRDYERRAADIMERHGARIERVIALEKDPEDHYYRELHVVFFPSENALAAYRNDPDFMSLATLRKSCILATAIRYGEAGPDYHEE